MPVDRRTMLIGGGAALVIAVTSWTLFGPAEATAPASAPRPRARQPAAAATPTTPETMVAVRLETLEANRDQPGDARRNPFRFQPKPAPPPPPPKPLEPGGPTNLTPAAPEPPRGPPPPPPITLKFIGVLEREDGTKWAVLTDGRGPLYGKEGGTVAGYYQILKIGVESIELAYMDGRGRQTIRMTGQ